MTASVLTTEWKSKHEKFANSSCKATNLTLRQVFLKNIWP